MRLSKVLLISVFVAILVAPVLQMATGAIAITPVDENRRLAARPTLSNLGGLAETVSKLQSWFDDHYGFRDLLIRAKAQMDFSIFGTSDKLHIGRDGFLFYRTVIDIQEPSIERLSEQDLDRAVGNFARIRDLLEPRGIHLIVQTQQLKDKFYPEKLPREAQFARGRHRFDEFRTKLAALPGISYFDTTPLLQKLKQSRLVFHKTDFHWNDPAAFVCAEYLTNMIAGLSGAPVPFWHNRLEIEARPTSGGQAIFMPLFRTPSEVALFVKPAWDESLYSRVSSPPFETIATRVRETDVPLLPPTVVLGDSFADGMFRSGLGTNFKKISTVRFPSAPLADILRDLPSDTKFLVIEFIEVSLPSYLNVKLPEPAPN